MPGLCCHLTLLNAISIFALISIANLSPASAQDTSFQSQFSNPTHFGLTVAGISLGAAISAALIGLLIFCLIQRRRKRDRLRKSQLATAAKKLPTVPGATATDFGGRIALPIGLAAPATAAATNGTAGTSGSGNGGAAAVGGSGGANSAKTMGQYVNPAFDTTDSGNGDSAGRGGNHNGSSLFRQSSALRPIQYGSPESSTRHSSLAGNSLHSLNRFDLDRPSVTHSVVRISPAGTATRQQPQSDMLLDPRHYLSDMNLSDRQKRLSMVSDSKLPSLLPHQHQQQQQQQQQQHQHQPASNPKRHSYAEQRATYSSSIELVSGQVFSTPAINSLPRQTPQRFPSQTPALPTQPEEPSASAGVGVGGFDKLKPHAEEGPSFPVTRAVPPPIPQPKVQRQDLQQQQEEQEQQLPQSGSSPQQRLKNLHRIDLSGGVAEGVIDDRRSVTSTVLKQEAIKAFDFLDSYDD